MPDGNDVRVLLAEIGGRLGAVIERLGRQEQACEERSRKHVDRDLYFSERDTIRNDVIGNRSKIERLQTELATETKDRQAGDKDLEDRRVVERRWLIAGVLVPTIGFAIPLLVVVLT